MTCDDRRAVVDDREDRTYDQAYSGAAPDDEPIPATVKEPAGPPRLDVSACSYRSTGHRRRPPCAQTRRRPELGRSRQDAPILRTGSLLSGGRSSSAIARDRHLPTAGSLCSAASRQRTSSGEISPAEGELEQPFVTNLGGLLAGRVEPVEECPVAGFGGVEQPAGVRTPAEAGGVACTGDRAIEAHPPGRTPRAIGVAAPGCSRSPTGGDPERQQNQRQDRLRRTSLVMADHTVSGSVGVLCAPLFQSLSVPVLPPLRRRRQRVVSVDLH